MAHHRAAPDRLMLVLVGGPALHRPDDADWLGGIVADEIGPTEEPPDVIVWRMWAPWRRTFVEYAYQRGEHLPDDGEIIYGYRLPLEEAGYDHRIALGEGEIHYAASTANTGAW